MSNGYLLAAAPDLPAAREISVGFGLEVIDAGSVANPAALADMLASAANVGLMISAEAARDTRFLALMHALSVRLKAPQLILASAEAHAPFAFLPSTWPAMLLSEARERAGRRRDVAPPPTAAPAPLPAQSGGGVLDDLLRGRVKDAPPEPQAPSAAPPGGGVLDDLVRGHMRGAPPTLSMPEPEPTPEAVEPEPPTPAAETETEAFGALVRRAPSPAGEDAREAAEAPQAAPDPAPSAGEEAEFSPVETPPPPARSAPPATRETAPADATAFAPKKLRRGTPELVRVVIHQPKDAKSVIKQAKQIDPYARPAPQGMSIGDIALGANVGIALEVRGARCEGALQRRSWAGEPIDFAFPIEPEDSAKQAVFLARVFVDDAQIGVLAFTRPIVGGKSEAAAEEVRLTRHKRVFISYASQDRDTVSVIATAYQLAGVEHFWDRASLKGGEEWGPRLKHEIERADLFHLCWSKAASQSEWVAKEAEHALKRRRGAKRPEITVQMLDGPPWAPHPPALDAINFDDFIRAAVVGYARGDGAS